MDLIRVGVIGTSEWTERMYMKPLQDHPDGYVAAVCARDPERTRAFAHHWNVPHYYTDWRDLLDSDDIDAVIISTPNDTHYPITMHALKNDLHVMCEKPLALNYAQADAMATEAERRVLTGMTAFTYCHFPHYRYIAHLLRDGYVGTPYHLNLRYYSGYGISGDPIWRFDRRTGGEGALVDIGSHALALARAFLGEVGAVSASLATLVERPRIPAAHRACDHAVLNLRFVSGTVGVIHVSMVSYQPKRGGQKQALELSGSEGTLYYTNDFATHFSLRGARLGDDEPAELHVPDALWHAAVSRDNPRDFYRDLFGKTNVMAREFVSAIAEDRPIDGADLREGAEVQKLLDAAVFSDQHDGVWVEV